MIKNNHNNYFLNIFEAGVTLIEMLVALALLSIILTALYSTFFISHRAVTGLDTSMLKLQECRAALDVIRRELDSSFYQDNDRHTAFKLDDRDEYGKQASRIRFTAFSPLRAGITEVSYFVEETDGRLTLYKGIASSFDSGEEIQKVDIIEDIGEFLIEAKYGDKWIKTWDSSLIHRLPEEVKVSIQIKIKNRGLLLSVKAKPAIT